MSECSIEELRDKVLQMLARREHTRHELASKLNQRDYPPSDIESVLQALQNEGLLSDARAAEVYIRQRAGKGYGELKISAELAQKGVDRDSIQQCLSESEVDWLALGRTTFEKKFGEGPSDDYRLLAKQQRFLASRGFGADVIRAVLRS